LGGRSSSVDFTSYPNKGATVGSRNGRTFPAVLVYQALAAPIAFALLLGLASVQSTLGANSTGSDLFVMLGILAALSVVLVASLIGFVEGWRTGWSYGQGKSLAAAVLKTLIGHYVMQLAKLLSRQPSGNIGRSTK
jgi:hypothetical protein